MKNQVVAGILALLFGIFGIHKFYLGRNGAGWLRVGLFFIFPILPFLAILSFIEAVQLLSMSSRTFDEKYNREELIYRSGRRQFDSAQGTQYRASESEEHRHGQRYRHAERRSAEAPPPQTFSRASSPAGRHKTAVNPHKTSGLDKYKEYDYEGAIEDFRQALTADPDDIATHFNIACAYSLTEQTSKALEHLDKAVRLGFNDFEKINNKDAFAYIRVKPEFRKFVENGYRLTERLSLDQPERNLLDDGELSKHLEELKDLRKRGVITQEEFLAYKSRLE